MMQSTSKGLITKPLLGIQHEIGFAYKSNFTFLLPASRFFHLEMWLLENGKKLPGPFLSSHKEIRELGAGRFSFWNGTVYFSTSDNSDPRSNGKIYTIQYTPNLLARIMNMFPGRLWRPIIIMLEPSAYIPRRVWQVLVALKNLLYKFTRKVWQTMVPQFVRHFVHSFREWLGNIGGLKEIPWELFYWLCFFFVMLRGKIGGRSFLWRDHHSYEKNNP